MGQLHLASLAVAGAAGLALGLLASPILQRLLRRARGKPHSTSDAAPATGVRRHPEWRPPAHQAPPFPLEPVLSFDPAEVGAPVLYPLVISAVVPRPIAFISTVGKDGSHNLSPYSYFNAVSHSPPVLAIGHCWSGGQPKDSLRNILDTGELVVSLISDWFVESANHTCGPYPRGVNEMELAGLTPLPSEKVTPPRVAESAVNFEARLLHHYDLKDKAGAVTCTVVLVEVVLIHIAEAVATRTPNSGKVMVDPEKLRPVCRLGGNIYGAGPALFEIARPDKEGRYPGAADFVPSERDRVLLGKGK